VPQFDATVFLPQMVWLAIFFAILYFGIVRLTLPKVGRVIAQRDAQVTGDLGVAETSKKEADRLRAEHDAGVARAQEAARARVAEAQAAAARSLEAKLAQSKAGVEARQAEADAALAKARGDALGQIERVAAEAAAEIVTKLTGTRPPESDAADAARAALA
jgi:F-type H+-transporting ATPase subunit b